MRGIALGRKNWIHVGSEKAGPKVAAIISALEFCRRLALPVRDYLTDVLPGMADVSIQKVAELTPSGGNPKPRTGRRQNGVALTLTFDKSSFMAPDGL